LKDFELILIYLSLQAPQNIHIFLEPELAYSHKVKINKILQLQGIFLRDSLSYRKKK